MPLAGQSFRRMPCGFLPSQRELAHARVQARFGQTSSKRGRLRPCGRSRGLASRSSRVLGAVAFHLRPPLQRLGIYAHANGLRPRLSDMVKLAAILHDLMVVDAKN